jgi:hypothetical protein
VRGNTASSLLLANWHTVPPGSPSPSYPVPAPVPPPHCATRECRCSSDTVPGDKEPCGATTSTGSADSRSPVRPEVPAARLPSCRHPRRASSTAQPMPWPSGLSTRATRGRVDVGYVHGQDHDRGTLVMCFLSGGSASHLANMTKYVCNTPLACCHWQGLVALTESSKKESMAVPGV